MQAHAIGHVPTAYATNFKVVYSDGTFSWETLPFGPALPPGSEPLPPTARDGAEYEIGVWSASVRDHDRETFADIAAANAAAQRRADTVGFDQWVGIVRIRADGEREWMGSWRHPAISGRRPSA